MKKTITIVCVLLILSCGIASAETILLKDDTKMHPAGWQTGYLEFKGGTEAVINEKGEVIKGILKYNESLKPSGNRVCTLINRNALYFKADELIVFDEKGEVIEGTLSQQESAIFWGRMDLGIRLSNGTKIKISESGEPLLFTMSRDTYFRPTGYQRYVEKGNFNAGFILFKGYTQVELNCSNEVLSGTLANDELLYLPTGGKSLYVSGSKIYFNEKGEVVKSEKT